MTPLQGTELFAAAQEAIIKQIDHGYPIPMLILRHRDKKYADYIWHWFLLNGYDDTGDAFLVKTVTYGGFEWLDFGELWNTGFSKRGGLVLYQGL